MHAQSPVAPARRVKFNGRGAFSLDFSLLPMASKRVLSSVINVENFDYSLTNHVYRAFRIYQQTTYLQRSMIVSRPKSKVCPISRNRNCSVRCKHIRQDRLFHLRYRTKAARAILDSDARRAAPHITYLRCDALASTRGREHRLLPLQISKRLFSNNKTSAGQ